MRILDGTGNCVGRTVPCTERTALTLLRIDMIGEKSLTNACRTGLIYNMGYVFIAEVL